ncbi:uncharacterized GMC-type oxidoreductase Mb1310-like [Amphiura filiformis]|uniref:uncharacterized GMC-type oxidoreductase Mb1310-like n=1 Tax=Amphiura filiformis TaxID=82378 RepID=UPI003B2226F0
MPSWVTDKTLKLRSKRDAAKKTYLLVRTHHAREVWRTLNTQLNESYRADELASIHRQMEDLQVANENGNYNTTWKIIHDISGKKKRSNPKVKKRDGTIPSSDKELLAKWMDYFCALLNNDNGPPTSDLPPPADQDLPICADPPTLEETRKAIKAMKANKAAGLRVELGYNEVDFNTGNNIGFGRTNTTITEKAQRCDTSRAFLEPARSRPNLTIVPNAHVTKIVIENKKAVGVQFLMGKEAKSVTVTKEVVLSAGAIGSPQILMLSGIGPKSHLEDIGIDCIHDLPVGDNLQDHNGIQVRADVDTDSGALTIAELGSIVTMAKYLFGAQSVLSTNGVEACGFYKTKVEDDIEWPDMQIHFVSTFYITGDDEEQFIPLSNKKFYPFFGHDVPKRQRLSREGVTFIPTLLHPRSNGTIRLKSSNPLDPPTIDPRYFKDDHDVKVMVEGVRMCKRLAETDAMKSKGTQIVNLQMPELPEDDEFSDENLSAYCRHFCCTIYHPIGTCKMGAADDNTAVVDPQLRVHGIDGLRVIDASVMPHLTSGNTNAPTIMIGEKGADLLKDEVY